MENPFQQLGKSFDLVNSIYAQLLELEENSEVAKAAFEALLCEGVFKRVKILKWDYENAVVEFDPMPEGAALFSMSKVVTKAVELPDGNTEVSSELVLL
jgi:hypothetical protein